MRITQGIDYPLYQLESTYHIKSKDDEIKIEPQNIYLGTLFEINGEPIIISPPNNIYELKEEGFVINSNSNISSPVDVQLTVYFTAQLDEEVDTKLVPISLTYYKINGQLNRIFKPNILSEDVFSLLQSKYTRSDNETESYALDSLFTADIEAEPGTVLYAKSSAMDTATKFVINENGNLHLDPGVVGVTITSLKFSGRQFDIRYLDPLYYWDESYHYEGTAAITYFNNKHNKGTSKPSTAKDYDYYIENNSIYMYYRRAWYPCEKINDYVYEITCPVLAIVNYQIQQVRGVYQRS